jgi:hypothetical protein
MAVHLRVGGHQCVDVRNALSTVETMFKGVSSWVSGTRVVRAMSRAAPAVEHQRRVVRQARAAVSAAGPRPDRVARRAHPDGRTAGDVRRTTWSVVPVCVGRVRALNDRN